MNQAQKCRILLADDHRIVRDGLRLLINGQPDMLVVGEAADGKEALKQARTLKPDIVVMDLSMPELNGLQATQLLKSERPDLKIIALTAHEDETYLAQLCKAGASGYVLKRSAGEELIQAIGLVAKGGVYFEPGLAGKALIRQVTAAPEKQHPHHPELSEREKEVLLRLAWGYSNKEVAGELGLSVKTVETYKGRIGEKLHLRSRTELVQYALRQGWLSESQQPLAPPSKPRSA